MKVRIGNLEITDVTPDELDALIKKYGNASASKPPAGAETAISPNSKDSTTTPAPAAADTVLLRKFVEAGNEGLTTIDVGTILGRRGKAARPAVKEWAKRVRLIQDDDSLEPFEDARVGTQRGLRLKSSLRDVAKHLLGEK